MQSIYKFFVFVVFFILHSAGAYAQSHRVIHYSLAEGLPSSQVLSLMEDKLGYLWIGTFGGGLVRFDGKAALGLTNSV